MHGSRLAAGRIHFGAFVLDVRTGELRKGSARLRVPDQSVEVLKALLERPGELVTREELRQGLWPGDTFVDFEQGLNGIVRRLREALGDSADAPAFIETLPRRGYRFIGRIEAFPIVPPESDVSPGTPMPAQASNLPRRWRRRYWQKVLVVLLAVGAALVWAGNRRGTEFLRSSPPKSIPVTSFPGVEIDPALSPDGNHVAFASQPEGSTNIDLYVQLLDGGAPILLAASPEADRSPAWSPDGRRIAYLRGGPNKSTVVIIPAFGGPERVVTETETAPANRIGWTPDGRSLVIVDRVWPGTTAIFLYAIDSGERRQLTFPTRDFADSRPAVSPDGRGLAFVRRVAWYSGGSVYVLPLGGPQPRGEPRRLTHENYTLGLDWAHDGAHIFYDIFGGSRSRGLWRVPVGGGEPEPVLTNARADNPSVAEDGSRILYVKDASDGNIWRIPGLPLGGRQRTDSQAVLVAPSSFREMSPQFSAGGDRIAFVSYRSGDPDIWVSQSDGSQPMQLTTFGGAFTGSPRWSPDGRFIAFDSMRAGSWDIYVIGSQGGEVRAITQDSSNDVRASWSGDGRWIYFGSNRSGDWQIWKIPIRGRIPLQITKGGGFEAFESADGEHLYYAKSTGPGIWRVPVNGGEEIQILDRGRETAWALTEGGIFLFHNLSSGPRGTIEFFDLSTRRTVPVASLSPRLRFDQPNPSFAVSRDGRWILYVAFDYSAADVEMLELR